MGITQVQGTGQPNQAHGSFLFLRVALATELHEVFGSSHIRQVLAVVTALSMFSKVVDHMYDPIEAAKWPMQLVVNYVHLAQADASGRFWKVKPRLHMVQ